MKRSLFTATAIAMLCTSAFAAETQQQNPMANMSQEDIQKMQKAGMEMMQCVQNAGGNEMLMRISARSEEILTKLKGLCGAGKLDAAEQEAIDFGKEMAADVDVEKMKKCGEMGQQMVESMDIKIPAGKDGKPMHVCDGFK